MDSSLTMGEVSGRSGHAPSALRFYESRGLIEADRTSGGQRRYRRDVLRRLAFIRAARHVGLTLEEVGVELRRLPGGRPPTAQDWAQISRSWSARIDDQITALQSLRERLTSCIGCGCLSLKACVLSNPDDALARNPGTNGAALLPPLLRAPID